MYKAFYKLTGDPFRLSPDHAFCYRHPSFAKGRAYMQYALQAAEGFVVITGAPGMGKTTLINDLLSDYGPSDYLVATMVNTLLEADDILRSAAYEFGVNAEALDTATLLQRLKQLFTQCHQERRPPLLIVDEAQNLSHNALEELRMLTNLQFQGKPLLQIFLVGQEGLRDKLQNPRLEQLRQRVTAAAHLHPLNQEQTAAYILHRLRVVGWDNFPRIKASVLPVIESACLGVPRRINQFCSRLLLHGAVEERSELTGRDARMVFEELSDERLSSAPHAAPTDDLPALGPDDSNWKQAPAYAEGGSTPVSYPEVPGQADQQGRAGEQNQGYEQQHVHEQGQDPEHEQGQEHDPARTQDPASEAVFAAAEDLLRDDEKLVMPPPGSEVNDPPSPFAVPGMEDIAAGHSDRQPAAPSSAETPAHLQDPHFDRRTGPPAAEPVTYSGQHSHPAPPRRPLRRPVFGVVMLVVVLVGAGAYAWYRFDARGPLRSLARQLEPHLPIAAAPPAEPAVAPMRPRNIGFAAGRDLQ